MKHAVMSATTGEPEFVSVNSSLMTKVFCAFAVLVALSGAISLMGKWFGHSIAMAGFTDDLSMRKIVIGSNVIATPANTIRFERARRDGVAQRLDLYLRWPTLDGYSHDAREDFNHTGQAKRILFLTFEERMMSRDMSGRFEPIYTSLIDRPGASGPAGIKIYKFTEKSGYVDEVLAVAARAGKDPFVARCLTGGAGADSLAPCERDIQVGDNLSLTYRFPMELLAEWQALDEALAVKAARMMKTAP